jgi:hypothetical protein
MKAILCLILILPAFLRSEIQQLTFHLQSASCTGCAAGRMRIIQRAESIEKAVFQPKEKQIQVTLKPPLITSLEPIKTAVRNAIFNFLSVDVLAHGTLRQAEGKYFLDVSQTKLSFELQIGPQAVKSLQEKAGRPVKLLGKEIPGKQAPTLEFLEFKN